MNKSKAKQLPLDRMHEVLPEWYLGNIRITFRLLSSNTYIDFPRVRNFLEAALQHLTPPEDEEPRTIRHALAEVADKGVNGNYQYITVDVYLAMEGGAVWKITKSCKVKLRNIQDRLD